MAGAWPKLWITNGAEARSPLGYFATSASTADASGFGIAGTPDAYVEPTTGWAGFVLVAGGAG